MYTVHSAMLRRAVGVRMVHVMRDSFPQRIEFISPARLIQLIDAGFVADSYRCVPTLSEVPRRVVSIQAVQGPSGKIQTARIPPFAEIPIVSPWQATPDRNLACARLGKHLRSFGTVLTPR
jgi:hypothetical protein